MEAGADEAVCRVPDPRRLVRVGTDVRSKLTAALSEHADVNLVFAQRDADDVSGTARRQEIERALRDIETSFVAVVPVQELEAWLLTEEAAIRWAVGRPKDRTPLGLPPLRQLESKPDPKSILESAIQHAQGSVSKRRKVSFERARGWLLQNLDLQGPIRLLPSFRQLIDDVDAVIQRMRAKDGPRDYLDGTSPPE